MTPTASQIIDENGGPAAFALKVGKRPGAVRAWKHRNCIPREAWPEIIQAYPDLTLEKMIEIEASRATLSANTDPALEMARAG